jgi:hypothetical protein
MKPGNHSTSFVEKVLIPAQHSAVTDKRGFPIHWENGLSIFL